MSLRHNQLIHNKQQTCLFSMKKWIVFGLVVAALAALAGSAAWWLPPFLRFAGTNADVIQSVTSLAQLAIWVVAALTAAFGFWFSRKKGAPQPDVIQHAESVQAVGASSVAINQATNSNIVTGDGAVLADQINITIQEAQANEITYLHQLPPAIEDFTDRIDEVAELQSKLNDGTRVYGLFGMGGIGKSDLAKKFAEQHLSDLYPDAQFYLDLKGASQQPKDVSEAQRHIISSCRATEKLSESDGVDLGAKYNNALYGKRALLLLDNASNGEQVTPLMPPSKCAVVITSREKITLAGMHAMTLATLKREDARSLLLRIAPRIGDQADTIATLCGGLPMALRLAGGAIAGRPDLKVDDYVKGLADKKQRLELVEASLDFSFELLPEERQNQFSLLSVFPETFDAGGSAAIWGLPLDEARAALGDFLKFSLLEWHERAGRYRLQTLVRDFADAHVKESERSAIQSRHALYYLKILREAGRLYLRGGTVSKEGLNLFDAERANTQAAQSWIESHIGDNDVAAAACENHSYAGSQLLALKQAPLDRIKWHEAIIAASHRSSGEDEQEAKLRLVEAENLTFLGIAYRDLGDYDKSIEYCDQALLLAQKLKNAAVESDALGYSGIGYYYKGNYEEASIRVRRALEITGHAEVKNRSGEVEKLRYLGHAHRGLGQFEEAIDAYERSLAAARQWVDLSGENNALGALGRIYCDIGKQEVARTEYLPRALELAIEIGDRRDECYSLGHLGLALRDLGLYAEAKDHYERGLKLAVEIGHRQVETYCRGGLGKTYLALNDLPSGLSSAQLAVKLADEIKMKRARQYWRTLLAQLYLYSGRFDYALATIIEAGAYGSAWVNYRTHTLRGLILAKLDQVELAVDAFTEGSAHAEQLLTKTPGYFDARYILGIATFGLALTKPEERAKLVAQACVAIEEAYNNCNAQGITDEAVRLLEEFSSLDKTGEPNGPREFLKQLAAGKSPDS
jgi:tetratricopeptide (TPR) repeat protein